MIQITPQMKIMVAIEPADFRRGIDGLSRLCREELKSNPFSGALFVFKNRRSTAIKILTYDGQGMWIFHKRLSKNRFKWWPEKGADGSCSLDPHQLHLLLWNGNPDQAQAAPFWRRVAAEG